MFDPKLLQVHPDSAEPVRSGIPFDVSRLLDPLRRGARVLCAAGAAGVIVGAAGGRVLVQPSYRASVSVVRDATAQTNGDMSRSQKTVADDVKLEHNLAEVRRRLGLKVTLPKLATLLEVEGANESALTTIRARGGDPVAATQLADTVAAVFLDSRRELERKRAEDHLASLARDDVSTRRSLSVAREAYDAFRREHGITDLMTERQSAFDLAARLRSEATLSGVDAVGEEEREKTLRRMEKLASGMMIVGERGSNPAVTRLRDAEADVARLRGRLSADHPQLLAAESEVESLRKEASRPPPTVETTLGRKPDWEVAQRGLAMSQSQRAASRKKNEALSELYVTARLRAEELSALEGRSTELFAAVRSADQRLLEIEVDRLATEAASRSPSAGFRLVADAARPAQPERSLRTAAALGATALFVLVAAIILVARSLRGLRLVSPGEIAYWGGAPVVGASAWPLDQAALADLAADLAPLVTGAGTLLVLGDGSASALAPALAAALSQRLGDAAGAPTLLTAPGATGSALRRAARDADAVLLVVMSGERSVFETRRQLSMLGRDAGVGIVVAGLSPTRSATVDRVGDFSRFLVRARA